MAPSGIEPASCAETTSIASPASRCSLRLADAKDRNQARSPSAGDLAANDGIGLAMAMAPLGMSDDHMAAAEIRQHLGADVAGIGALWGGVAVLAAEGDAASGEMPPTAERSVAGGQTRSSQRARRPPRRPAPRAR